ncbi:unnamed protein product [Neospora caninum Liverpool]|uniref:Uncharacterized protein n=1 Tax=Neospora caninum (strain Liverpool) TaxID=572307 RepID=F0V9S5_NEOCL|nr:uncharacterized protein NCLIV_007105 [Neospora caninum Liverpool]CBZ50236.1 unnamed protein product [Neospora caninum Liverpool]CEL64837.1 TPA: hypothetical protein BN1204_007105_1 [Neospora caninum Liverpool]|eukprot:XP_003880271.1 uncharacterized protein NCLIV_007105 [Neospora caninum Liverpool]
MPSVPIRSFFFYVLVTTVVVVPQRHVTAVRLAVSTGLSRKVGGAGGAPPKEDKIGVAQHTAADMETLIQQISTIDEENETRIYFINLGGSSRKELWKHGEDIKKANEQRRSLFDKLLSLLVDLKRLIAELQDSDPASTQGATSDHLTPLKDTVSRAEEVLQRGPSGRGASP